RASRHLRQLHRRGAAAIAERDRGCRRRPRSRPCRALAGAERHVAYRRRLRDRAAQRRLPRRLETATDQARRGGVMVVRIAPTTSSRAKRSNPGQRVRFLDCFVATLLAMTMLLLMGVSPARADWKADWDAAVAGAKKEGALVLSVPAGRAWR